MPSNIELRFLETDIGDRRWRDFLDVDAGRGVSIFQSDKWARVVCDTYGYAPGVVLGLNGDTVEGALLFAEVNDFRGNRRVVFPFADASEPTPAELWPAFEQYFASQSVSWTVRTRCVPAASEFNEVAAHHTISLPATSDQARALFHAKHLQNVKQAEKAGLRYRISSGEEGLRIFYDLHSRVRKQKHRLLPQPYRFFEAIGAEFLPENGFIFLAQLGQQTLAAMFFLAYGSTLYYKFSASDLDALHFRPNHFLITCAIEEAIARGYSRLDLGISDTEGLIRFKERIGGRSVPVFSARYGSFEKSAATVDMERAIGAVTDILTRSNVPLDAAQLGSDALYKFFV